MRWTERQVAMLDAMGVRLWSPRGPAPAEPTRRETANRVAVATVVEAPPVPRPPAAPALDGDVATVVDSPPVPRAPAAPAARGDVATMGWQALRDTVAACTACRLCESRRQTVFGVGPVGAHWMVVGEAPGEQEDRQGEPFVGKSGQLLDRMLQAIGVARSAPDGGDADDDPARRVYIANTVKCRPPGNRNPEPDELARCEAYLLRQIELVQPKIILAMGRFAIQGLLRSSEPVGRLRGRVHRYHGVPLVATYHPAYLLRNLEDKAKAWDDLCLAVETLHGAGAAP